MFWNLLSISLRPWLSWNDAQEQKITGVEGSTKTSISDMVKSGDVF